MLMSYPGYVTTPTTQSTPSIAMRPIVAWLDPEAPLGPYRSLFSCSLRYSFSCCTVLSLSLRWSFSSHSALLRSSILDMYAFFRSRLYCAEILLRTTYLSFLYSSGGRFLFSSRNAFYSSISFYRDSDTPFSSTRFLALCLLTIVLPYFRPPFILESSVDSIFEHVSQILLVDRIGISSSKCLRFLRILSIDIVFTLHSSHSM